MGVGIEVVIPSLGYNSDDQLPHKRVCTKQPSDRVEVETPLLEGRSFGLNEDEHRIVAQSVWGFDNDRALHFYLGGDYTAEELNTAAECLRGLTAFAIKHGLSTDQDSLTELNNELVTVLVNAIGKRG